MSLHTNPSKRRWLVAPLVLAACAFFYAFAGFVLVPWIAARELPRLIEQELHQRARIGEIGFNPFTLELRAREFALETSDGRPLLGFADAVLRLRWLSLLRRAWLLDEVRLVDPALHLEIGYDGRLNFAALLPESKAEGSTPRLALGHVSVANGSVDFEDRRQGYRNRVERLSIDLTSLSTLDAEEGSYALAGETPGGAKLRWNGKIELAPLAVSGTLVLTNAPLAELKPYVGEFTALRIVSGRADLELPYRIAPEQEKLRFSLKGATLGLRELALSSAEPAWLAKFGAISIGGIDFDSKTQHASVKTARIAGTTAVTRKDRAPLARFGPVAADGVQFALGTRRASLHALAVDSMVLAAGDAATPLAALGRLALEDAAFDPVARRFSAKGLRASDFALALERDASGELNALRGFSSGRGEAAPSTWQASIASVEITGASARYTDRTAPTPLALAADGLNASFGLDLTAGGAGTRLRIDSGKLDLAQLDALAASAPGQGASAPALRLAQLSLAGARYDSGANTLEAETLGLGSLNLDTALENGRLALLDLVPAAGKTKSDKPLAARVKAFQLGEGSVSVADRSSGIEFALARLSGRLRNVSTDKAQPLDFELSADVKSGGRIALRGRAVPAQRTLRAKLEATGVALAPAATALARYANVKLGSGEFSLSGALQTGEKDGRLAYSGSASVADLRLDDPTGARLLSWKSLATESLKLAFAPVDIDIDELTLTAPAARLAIAKGGSSNLSLMFPRSKPAADAGAARPGGAGTPDSASPGSLSGAKVAEARPGDQSAYAVAVRRVRVEQGALDFSDDSLSQQFVAKIYELAGTANGLSTERDARSQFVLEGRVDEFGYAHLSGAVNPFAPRNRSAFRMQLRNIDLTTATPYAMRFAGYRIASGRLGLDLNYRVRESVIEGDNKITLEEFTLGERVDSPDALKLPFELAVKLLKDPDGTIRLEVPVKGNLDDPKFSLAPLIWEAVGHFIGNIVTAPFRALAHLFGGRSGEDLGAIAFDPGRAKLLPPEREKLTRVVAALAQHPELKLIIPAHYDAEADARAMKRADLNREIGRRAGFDAVEDEEPGPVNIEDRGMRKALRTLFAERFSKAELDRLRTEAEAKSRAAGAVAPSLTTRLRNFATGEPQLVDTREFHQTLLRRLRESQTLPANALAELAQKRALAIEAALKAAGADPSRMVRTISDPSSDAEAKQVTAHLSLAAR